MTPIYLFIIMEQFYIIQWANHCHEMNTLIRSKFKEKNM